MSWREQIEPDWFHEAPFYLAAIIAHGALLTFNPVINWGSLAPAEKMIPVEFVAEIPLPPIIQPAPPPETNRRGDGSNAPPKPVPKPAPVKSKINKAGTTVRKAKAALRPRPPAKPAVDAQAMKFARAVVSAKAAAAKAERDRFAARQAAERERRAALARAEAERRAEAAREAAETRAAALAEQRRLAAEAKAVKAAKRAELSSALAAMAEPDETLEAAPAPSPSGRGSARKGRPAAGGPVARKAGAAAALAESANLGDAAGGDSGLIDSKARGGGPEGGGVSFSVDGPMGNRRILTRVAPSSPDWIATRNLDLTVAVRFQVLPDGSVKPGAVIQKTSGFPDIDARALKALARWRFQPVATKAGAAEVWGRVIFRFTS